MTDPLAPESTDRESVDVTSDRAHESDLAVISETEHLLSRARKGDRNAFDELVRSTYVDMYTLAYRMVGNEEDARDVVQDAYLRAYKGLKKFRGDAQFGTWLYRITANCASTALSRRQRHRHEELFDDASLPESADDDEVEQYADRRALRDQIHQALADLPPRLRAVVVLRDVYDLPHQAIAEELGISESAAKVRLHRARRKLRETLYPMASDRGESEVIDRAV